MTRLRTVLSFLAGTWERLRADRWFIASLAVCVAMVLAIQIGGKALDGEFSSHPDEAGQFVSGLAVYDYLHNPTTSPIVWAGKYYLHYPRIAIGRWPPGFAAMEAFWWTLFRPSRLSALALESALVTLSGVLFFRLARRIVPPPAALAATILLLASRVSISAYVAVMADAPCLLFSVLLTGAIVELLENPSKRALGKTAAWLLCGLFIKGTALCLIPAPALATLLAGRWRNVPRRWLFTAAGVSFAIVALLYLFRSARPVQLLRSLSGFMARSNWEVMQTVALAGPGFLLLAVAGIAAALVRKRPVAVAAAGLLCSTVAVSYVMRAMREERHWIIVLPAILLLSAEVLEWTAQRRPRLAATACIAALAVFPFGVVPQEPTGFRYLARQFPLPARLLVSSNALGEGPAIAEIALADPWRPASTVVRANKTLAAEGWNGENYKLLTPNEAAVSKTLDELRVDIVFVHLRTGSPVPPHQMLLTSLMSRPDAAWRRCGASREVEAYCRTRPATVPAKPLRIDLRNRNGMVLQEEF